MKHIFPLLLFVIGLHAQSTGPDLPLAEAIEIALANNPDLQLLSYDRQISQNNIDPTVAGIGPRIELNGSLIAGYGDTRVETVNLGPPGSDNPTLELDGERYGVVIQPEANWLVFDGGRGKARLKQLELVDRTVALTIQNVQEQTIAGITALYLAALRIRTQRDLSVDNIALSTERLSRVENATRFGTGGELPKLRASVDLRADSLVYRQLNLELEKIKVQLNQTIGREPGTTFTLVAPVQEVNGALQLEQLQNELTANNEEIILARQRSEQSLAGLELAERAWSPNVQLYGNVNYLRQTDNANFLIENRNYGAEVGARVSYTLYDGGQRRIEQQNAKLRVEQSRTNEEKVKLDLAAALQRAWADYRNGLREIEVAQNDLALFELNYEKSERDFATGLIDATVLRAAQLNLTAARVRIANEIYDVREAELELLRLTGGLVK